MIHYSSNDIKQLEHIFKINLINCCSGYKSANLIGTVSNGGETNVAVFSSLTHLGSQPPLLGFFLRPTTIIRNTYENIKETGCYTINHVYQNIIEDSHHTSAKYEKHISEFDKTELNEDYKYDFQAPFVKNAPIQIGMNFRNEYLIKENNTILLVGEIIDLYINEELLENDGFINLSKGKIATINGLDGYAVPELKKRLAYERPNR
jgi:flavin reductase (DIM6/NTAB) family NADH-FMN oxidoreductase RutF